MNLTALLHIQTHSLLIVLEKTSEQKVIFDMSGEWRPQRAFAKMSRTPPLSLIHHDQTMIEIREIDI